MKTLNYFQLEINKTKPLEYNTITVNKTKVAAINNFRLVIDDDYFTKVTLDKSKAVDYHEIGVPSSFTLSKADGNFLDLIIVEMYCHYQNREDFIRYCNEILAASADYSNYYVNALGDVMEITHDHD